jgi:hypothetical protein
LTKSSGCRPEWPAVWFAIAVCVIAAFVPACDRPAELEADLRARQAQWTREIAAIRLQQTNILAQFQSIQAPATAGSPAFAAHARTKAVVLGAYQAVSDLDNVARQAAQRVQAAIKSSAGAGARALEAEHAQVLSEVRQMWEHLGTTQKELVELQQTAALSSVAQGG